MYNYELIIVLLSNKSCCPIITSRTNINAELSHQRLEDYCLVREKVVTNKIL